MADFTGIAAAGAVAEGGKPKKSASDILATARARLDMAVSALAESREDEIDDLRFYAGSPDNHWQWPADVLATRGAVQGQTINARPCLTINKLPQHVRQVTNDQRQNRPGAKVIPVDDNADVEVADIFNGMIRHIEYISDADVAYDTACENQVSYGEGYLRLLTEYCDDNTFDQDIKIGRVRNSFSVYMDPTIQDPTGADAKWCFVTEDVTKAEFERMYPDASPITTLQSLGVGDQSISNWLNEDTIRIADYYYIDFDRTTLNLYPGNATAFEGTPEDKQLRAIYGKPKKSRESDRPKVKYCKINGYEILEEREWAGKYIPVIRIVGNEFEVDGRLYVSGLVRNAKDAQRMYNYWVSQEAEMLATVASLKATNNNGRPPTRRTGRIWRSIQTLQTAKAACCHYPSGHSRQWPPAAYCKPRQGRLKTSRAPQVNTTHLWAWAPMSAAAKPFWRANAKAMWAHTITATTWPAVCAMWPANWWT
jgi:hypothetical protein